MSAVDLLALAERCEKADGPDRDLDLLIHEALGHCAHRQTHREECDNDGYDLVCSTCGSDSLFIRERYTASYDAAMSLVPTDGSMKLVEFSFTTEPDQPQVWPAASVRWYPPFKSGADWHAMVVTASTLILTICAAALRALATSRSQHEGAE